MIQSIKKSLLMKIKYYVKNYQWDSGEEDKEAEEIAKQILHLIKVNNLK